MLPSQSSSNHYAAYLPEVGWVAQHVHIKELRNISATICIVFLSERRADSSTLFLDHLTLLCLGPCCPDSPDQLPQSNRSWHSLKNKKKKHVGDGPNHNTGLYSVTISVACKKQKYFTTTKDGLFLQLGFVRYGKKDILETLCIMH